MVHVDPLAALFGVLDAGVPSVKLPSASFLNYSQNREPSEAWQCVDADRKNAFPSGHKKVYLIYRVTCEVSSF